MDEETDVLDWENEYEQTQQNPSADDPDDRVSLGGDDADENEYYLARKDSTGPPPSSQVTELSNEDSKTRQSTESSVTHHSEQQPSAPQPHPPAPSPKSPRNETHKAPPNLTHALPPKPVAAAAAFAPRREHPSTTAATSMRLHNKTKEPPLPPDWEMKASRSGSGWYYYNVRTFETTWIRPQVESQPNRPSRVSSDSRSTDHRQSVEPARNSHGSRGGRRPPSDSQPSGYAVESSGSQMTYEDRHYRPGEGGDDVPAPEFSHNSRTTSSQQWDYDEGGRSRGSRRTSSLDRNSSTNRSHTRDSSARGLRDDAGRSWQPVDTTPSRHQSQQFTDTYIPSIDEPRQRGRTEQSRMSARNVSPPPQSSKSSRPRSPRPSYSPVQIQPADPPPRKRTSRFDQAAPAPPPNSQNEFQEDRHSLRETNVADPLLPDEFNFPPSDHRRDAWETQRVPPEHSNGAYSQEKYANLPQSYPSPPAKRPPLPPQHQSFQQARKGPRPRSSSPPRTNPQREERLYNETTATFPNDAKYLDDGYTETAGRAHRGSRGPSNRHEPLPPPPIVNPENYPPPETNQWRPSDPPKNSRPPNPRRDSGRSGPPMPPPAPPFPITMSGSNSTPIPNPRGYGALPPSTVPRNESAPIPPGYPPALDMMGNRLPGPPPPFPPNRPTYEYADQMEPFQNPAGRSRRASLSERMVPKPQIPVEMPQRPPPTQRQYPQSYDSRVSPVNDRGYRPPTHSPEVVHQRDLPPHLDDDTPRFRPRDNGNHWPLPDVPNQQPPPSFRQDPSPPRNHGPPPPRWDSNDGNGSVHSNRGRGGDNRRGNRRAGRESQDNERKTTTLLERMSMEGPPSLTERVQVPNKRDFEGEEDQDSTIKKRRKSKRAGGRRSGP